MNLTILKSPGLWIGLITAVVGLLVSQGVILSGSSVDMVIGYVVAILGAIGGHHVAALPAATPAA
jgi:hypothetical protein